jgi:hypothetical protein
LYESLSCPTLLSSNAWHCKRLETHWQQIEQGRMVLIKQCSLMASTFLVQNHFCLDQSTQEQLRVSGNVTLESGISKFNKHLLRM